MNFHEVNTHCEGSGLRLGSVLSNKLGTKGQLFMRRVSAAGTFIQHQKMFLEY